MRRLHVLIVATVLMIAAGAGLFSVLRTVQLGGTAHARVAGAQIARRNRQLDRIEASLAAQARRKPPPLPSVGGSAALPPRPAAVVYVRPKPIVRVVHRAGEREHENEAHGGEEGGLDD